MKDYARVAQLSAEEAMRLVLQKEKDADQARWAKFDAELSRRVAEVTGRHNAETAEVAGGEKRAGRPLGALRRMPPRPLTMPARRTGWPPGRSFRGSLDLSPGGSPSLRPPRNWQRSRGQPKWPR